MTPKTISLVQFYLDLVVDPVFIRAYISGLVPTINTMVADFTPEGEPVNVDAFVRQLTPEGNQSFRRALNLRLPDIVVEAMQQTIRQKEQTQAQQCQLIKSNLP
ncbi:hypothetical protein [Spirosoma endbachense]|uniref:Uncharacterized protein n=1 Tax=Spirosoma endbachense TaxID=2666025 RepID=A0A6P1W1C7_9BACT|nr:hypothetical protein [Spirosoma endbachense]QHV99203.1 hypothetical protein GJR95_31190 [Spirosoma endbachense]